MNKCGIILPPSHLRAVPHVALLLLISQGDFHVPDFILTPNTPYVHDIVLDSRKHHHLF